MSNNNMEEKIKVNGFLDLLKAPENSWVEINGNNEFKISHRSLRVVKTVYPEGKYVCENTYVLDVGLETPSYVKKFFKGIGDSWPYIKILNGKGGLKL